MRTACLSSKTSSASGQAAATAADHGLAETKFPLIRDGIFKDYIEDFHVTNPSGLQPQLRWCFHRNPILSQMFDDHPEKMACLAQEQRSTKGQWKKEMSYTKIKTTDSSWKSTQQTGRTTAIRATGL